MTDEQTWSPAEKAWRVAISRGIADGLSPVATVIARECFMAGRESLAASPSDAEILRRAARILATEAYPGVLIDGRRWVEGVKWVNDDVITSVLYVASQLEDRERTSLAALRTTKEGEHG